MPADQGPPSYDMLAALVVSLRGELAGALAQLGRGRAELDAARERIGELEARLAKTSQNSSKPPSSDGLGKPAPKPRSLRKKTGRRPGGQDGHQGQTLVQVVRPDREVRHEPACCGGCGAGLAGRPATGVERRQVFGLPPLSVEVTEHQLIERECGCGRRTKAAAPQRAQAPVQYGPRIAAIIVYLYSGQFLSPSTTPGRPMTPTPAQPPALLRARPPRTAGGRRRGARGANGAGPPRPPPRSPRCKGWSAKRSPRARDAVDPAALATQAHRYRSAALIGISQTTARSGDLMKKHNALAHRLLDRQSDYLRFTRDWRPPPDNNGCERDIRMTKLKQKISGCLRALAGARQFCAIRSYLSTAAKHGLHSFDALVLLTEGRPWMPDAA